MRPAFSIVFFTVTSGIGYGWVAVSLFLDLSGIAPFASPAARLWSEGLALVLITLGLLSSTAHLANPRNAWRAVVRVRTSWLSREAVLAILFYPVLLSQLMLAMEDGGIGWPRALGWLSLIMAVGTIVCTAMIYACLRTIRQWRTPLTPFNFLSMALALGGLCELLARSVAGSAASGQYTLVMVLILLAFAGKLACYLSLGLPASATIDTATGFRMATVRLLDVGHTAGTFLTDEFGFQISRAALLTLRLACLLSGFVLPALIVAGVSGSAALVLALLLAMAGAFIERWLFFAEAQHVVRLYHGQRAT